MKAMEWRLSLVGLVLVVSAPCVAQEMVQGSGLTLPDSVSLVARHEEGAVHYYRVSKRETIVDASGLEVGLVLSSGTFRRETLHANENGGHLFRYAWKHYEHGRIGPGVEDTAPMEVRAIRGFTYDLRSADSHSVPPIEIGGLAKTSDTFAFFTLAWDAAIIESAGTSRKGYPLEQLNTVGARIKKTRDAPPADFDFTPIVSGFSYTRGGMDAELAGYTLAQGIPSSRVKFESASGPFAYRHTDGRTVARLSGRRWIRGNVLVGLEGDGVIEGEMFVVSVMSQQLEMPGQRTSYPVTVLQSVSLRRISKSEYQNSGS